MPCLVDIPGRLAISCRKTGGVDLGNKGGGGGLGDVEEVKTAVRMYCMSKELIFSQNVVFFEVELRCYCLLDVLKLLNTERFTFSDSQFENWEFTLKFECFVEVC